MAQPRRKSAPPQGRRVWIVLGWNHGRYGRYLCSSTGEQRWHWTLKSAKKELDAARKLYTSTNWKVVRMVPFG